MIVGPDNTALVIFCKRPKVGIGKQRVAAELGSAAALQLSSLLLDAVLADASDWPGPVIIAPAESGDSRWAEQLLPDVTVIPQQGRNLGERLNHVDRQLREAGRHNILFVGSDAPGLSPQTLAEAAKKLANHDATIIPAIDGGVTLLGSRKPWPSLAGLAWETDQLGAELIALCTQNGLTASSLPAGFDIDHYDDLQAAADTLREDSRPTRQALLHWAEQQHGISIVVPIMRDTTALTNLLDRLTPTLTDNDEIVVVDAEQSQACADVCAYFGARYVHQNASRGSRMNFGASSAANNILWFVHADAEPDINAPDMIRQTIRNNAHAGYFEFRFTGTRSLLKRMLASAINFRARIGIPYGDQGIFVTRSAFERAGGFADTALFEEVALVKALQRTSKFKRMLASIGVSPRRWERDGWLRRTLQNRLLVLGHWVGIPSNVLAQLYRRPTTQNSAAPAADNKGL